MRWPITPASEARPSWKLLQTFKVQHVLEVFQSYSCAQIAPTLYKGFYCSFYCHGNLVCLHEMLIRTVSLSTSDFWYAAPLDADPTARFSPALAEVRHRGQQRGRPESSPPEREGVTKSPVSVQSSPGPRQFVTPATGYQGVEFCR